VTTLFTKTCNIKICPERKYVNSIYRDGNALIMSLFAFALTLYFQHTDLLEKVSFF